MRAGRASVGWCNRGRLPGGGGRARLDRGTGTWSGAECGIDCCLYPCLLGLGLFASLVREEGHRARLVPFGGPGASPKVSLSPTLGFGLPWSCSFLTQCPQLPALARPGLGLAPGDWASPSGPHSPGEIPPNSVIREKMVCARWCIEQGQREDGTVRPGAVWDTS